MTKWAKRCFRRVHSERCRCQGAFLHLATVPSAVLKHGARRRRHFPPLQPQHDLVVQAQAARVQIRRADVYRVTDDEQFAVKHLGLVFEHVRTGPQQAPVEALRRQF